jgi:hypothetical protein
LTPNKFIFGDENNLKVTADLTFSKECTPFSYQLKGKKVLTLNGKSRETSLDSSSKELNTTTVGDVTTNSTTSSDKYEFINVPEVIVISKPNEKRAFRVQLIDKNKEVVQGKSISISSYDTVYGDLESMKVVTDSKGFANFSFTSPTSLEDIDGREFSLKVNYIEDKLIILSTTVTLKFRASNQATGSTKYKFQNATSLVVGHAFEVKTISIDLIDGAGVGVLGKSIQITTLGNRFGSFSSSTAQTNAAGRASFTYSSPKDFDSIDGQSTSATLTFTEDGVSISEMITISFQKSTDNTETDKVLPTVVIPASLRNTTLKSNSKSIEIQISVFKDIAPYAKGTVKVELPSKVLNGIDVGSFSSFEVPVNEQGIATFNYTGPANLKALLDAKDTSSVFKFYHSENTKDASRQEMVVNYSISADTYIPIDYTLSVNSAENDFSMGIPSLQKTFAVLLKDTKGNIINDNDVTITKIVVKTENALLAEIFDTNSNTMVQSLELRKENNSAFILKSKKLSGIVPLKVIINFIDINGEDTELSTIINVRVMSGPPSAISISYVSTTQDTSRAKYIEKFAVSVTDEYGNNVNTKPNISLGAIVGYTVDGKEASSKESSLTKRLFYGRNDISNNTANGKIIKGATPSGATFSEENTASEVFKWVNAEGENTDKLVVFGAGKNYEAMGKWDFSKLDDRTLLLEDDYFGENREKLYYAIGHNYYQDQCRNDGREWLGSASAESYQLDDEGTVIVSYKYDYHLTGKDALVWVNLNGYQADSKQNTRIGEVVKHSLRGIGLKSVPEAGYSLSKGTTGIASFDIHHEFAPEWYHNAKFGHRIKATTCSYSYIGSSNDYDARTCYNGGTGVAYLKYKVTAPIDEDCSFNIERIVVSSEF